MLKTPGAFFEPAGTRTKAIASHASLGEITMKRTFAVLC